MNSLLQYWQMIFTFMSAHPVAAVFMSPFLFVLVIAPFGIVIAIIEAFIRVCKGMAGDL